MNAAAHITQLCQQHGISKEDLTGPRKDQVFVGPRHECFLEMLCEVIDTNADGSPVYRSLNQVARHFDDRDHTTVLYGARKASRRLYGTPANASLAEIREAVQAARWAGQMGEAA